MIWTNQCLLTWVSLGHRTSSKNYSHLYSSITLVSSPVCIVVALPIASNQSPPRSTTFHSLLVKQDIIMQVTILLEISEQRQGKVDFCEE